MNILFWNINKKPLASEVRALCLQHQVHVLALAECEYSREDMLSFLSEGGETWHLPGHMNVCEKVKVFTRFASEDMAPLRESKRYSLLKLSKPGKIQVLLGFLHFLDKAHHDENSQLIEAINWAEEVRNVEDETGIQACCLVGDFNMNPYEPGMMGTAAFHATMSKAIARKTDRVVQGIPYRLFYNPMWSLYGDLHSEPSATYHYPHSTHFAPQWHMFDQVLIRPCLISRFNSKSLQIIHELPDQLSLLDAQGFPNKSAYSDHLPIFFSVNLDEDFEPNAH